VPRLEVEHASNPDIAATCFCRAGLMGPALPVAAVWPAEEVYLGWLLSLPAETDPGLAALAALGRIESLAGAGEIGRLRALLEETTNWTGPALAVLAAGPRTRRPS
jgi:hypothetical protein